MKNRLWTALCIAIVYAGIILLSIFVHEIFYDIFIVLIMIGAALEMSRAISKKFSSAMDVFVLLDIILGYAAFILVHKLLGKNSGGVTAYFGVLAVIFVACIAYNMFSKKKTMRNVISTMFVLIYPVSVLVYMLGLNYLPQRNAAILLLILISCLSDSFAFLVGITFKGKKLCPNISPKKTISGAIGGLLGGMLAAAAVMLFSMFGIFGVQPLFDSTAANIINFLVIGLFGSVFTQLGDLIASYIKRTCEIKDFGKILPGHGGILDRVDGMMINAIFIFVYMMVLTVL